MRSDGVPHWVHVIAFVNVYTHDKKSAIAGVRRQLDVLVSQQKLLGVEKELVEANLNIILYWLNLNKLASQIDMDILKVANSFLIKSDL